MIAHLQSLLHLTYKKTGHIIYLELKMPLIFNAVENIYIAGLVLQKLEKDISPCIVHLQKVTILISPLIFK